ncbi:RagB/SusD family nutrient uptake outer membrane protein [Joostella sp.]|uniref:RagB/SusD family nutrient uptake outer membrane protein n=1 Tax=Joostella sp. TaxID=2231138 RepID=UPI003A92B1DF
MKNNIYKIIALMGFFFILACEDTLDETVYSELTPDTVLTSESGIQSSLNAAYSNANLESFDGYVAYHYLSGMTSGEVWNRGGSIEVWFTALTDFSWDSNHRYVLGIWTDLYQANRDANIVLDNINNDIFTLSFKESITAQANFIRGWSYSELYNLFGTVPLYKSSSDPVLIPRASEKELKEFIESELIAASEKLPIKSDAYGKATKGAALAILTKFYLNTKRWNDVLDITDDIMKLGTYKLEANYRDVFSLSNEGNSEILWAMPKVAPAASQNINALIFPTDYPLPYSNNNVFAAKTYMFDDFVESFDQSDERRELIVTEYTNVSGSFISLLGNDQSLPLKYEFDPNSAGAAASNDIPVVRYADILLSRAEALNEVNGPNQESIDLLNQIRNRSKVSSIELGNFSKESLREFILIERQKEFFFEGKRREDQIRHGVFISEAQKRGKSAQDFHKIFAIPQIEIDSNPQITQNEGY